MSYYLDMNDGQGPKKLKGDTWTDALVQHLVSRFGYRYRMRDVNVTIVEKV